MLSFSLVYTFLAQDLFNPDPGVPPVRARESGANLRLKHVVIETPALNQPFNPDPVVRPVVVSPQVRTEFGLPAKSRLTNAAPPHPAMLRRVEIVIDDPQIPMPLEEINAPRENLRANEPLGATFSTPSYPLTTSGEIPPNTEARTNRWRIGLEPWQRYTTGQAETPYQITEPALWHPYRQSILKGDVPIIGQEIFLNLTASLQSEWEFRRVPSGNVEELFSQNYAGLSAEIFKGETVFRPARWRFLLRPVANLNHLESDQTSRTKTFFALQETYAEAALAELSSNYDLLAVRLGNQTFNSDFRGFIFNDVNSALRLFGNAANNRFQYNLGIFDMREKETFSELNSFDERGQQVIVANAYRQDTIWDGYTAQVSFHANFDAGDEHRNQSGTPVRPAPVGAAMEHKVHAYYLGWAGDGHIGRLNLTHAFYQVLGRDDDNAFSRQAVDISAQMAALELSIDQDWLRYKTSFFYASGDGNPTDGTATGFDSILDSPHFAGAPFSVFARQSFGLHSTGVNLKGRNSLLPSLRTSKLEGQANFVNPGLILFGIGAEARLTQKLRAFTQANYLRLVEMEAVEHALGASELENELGVDLSIGFQYRPLLANNILLNAGFGALVPGSGYRDMYPGSQFPYSGLLTLTFAY